MDPGILSKHYQCTLKYFLQFLTVFIIFYFIFYLFIYKKRYWHYLQHSQLMLFTIYNTVTYINIINFTYITNNAREEFTHTTKQYDG